LFGDGVWRNVMFHCLENG